MQDPKRPTLPNDRPQIRRNRFGRVVVHGEGIIRNTESALKPSTDLAYAYRLVISDLIDRHEKWDVSNPALTNDQNKSLAKENPALKGCIPWDGALEVTIENGSYINKMEEQPDDEEPRYWVICSLHRIARGNTSCRLLVGGTAGALAAGDSCVSEETRLSGMMGDHSEIRRSLSCDLRVQGPADGDRTAIVLFSMWAHTVVFYWYVQWASERVQVSLGVRKAEL